MVARLVILSPPPPVPPPGPRRLGFLEAQLDGPSGVWWSVVRAKPSGSRLEAWFDQPKLAPIAN